MKKQNTIEVMQAFAECLRQLYAAAGLEVPKHFDPDKESIRLASALVGKGLNIKP